MRCSIQADPAERQPCRTAGARFTAARARDHARPEGLERSRRANWKHGYFSREAKAGRSRVRAAILALRYLRITAVAPSLPPCSRTDSPASDPCSSDQAAWRRPMRSDRACPSCPATATASAPMPAKRSRPSSSRCSRRCIGRSQRVGSLWSYAPLAELRAKKGGLRNRVTV
jgi:hypothetical protein